MKVFISYRRDDSIIHARLIHNELAARFGAEHVFMDIEDIAYGDDFARRIDQKITDADVVVAVIGPRWSELLQRRALTDDYVRHELASSLQRGIRVVPVLVGRAPPPGEGLPPELAALRTTNALTLDERSLKPHINALVETLQGRSFEDVVHDLREAQRTRRRAQWVGAGVGLVVLLAAWVELLDFIGLDTRLASATMWLARLGAPPPAWSGEVVLVGIDDATVASVGRPFDTSWRREHARLVHAVAGAGARTIAFDLFVDTPAAPQDDTALEAAVRAARPSTEVVFAARRTEGPQAALLPQLRKVASAGIACAGHKLGYTRSMPLAVQRGEASIPSLALAAFSGGGRIEGIDPAQRRLRVRVPREERSPDLSFTTTETARATQPECEAVRAGDHVAMQLLDPFALPALRDPPQRVRYERLLSAETADLAMLRGRIVLVGLMLPGRDTMPLGLGAGSRWGVELIAQQLDQMVRGDTVRQPGTAANLATLIACAFAGAFARRGVRSRPGWMRAALAAVCVAALAVSAVHTYRSLHLLINLPYALAAFALAWALMARLDRKSLA